MIAIELTNTPKLKGNKRAISIVSSLIEGSGILVGAAFQIIIPYIGSDELFMLFTVVTVFAGCASGFIMRNEMKRHED